MRVLFLFEFPESVQEWLMPDLIRAVKHIHPSIKVDYFHGFLKSYTSTGLTWKRLLNMIYIYLRLPFHLILNRPDRVLVRTTPPCIQLYTVFWCSLLRIPTICWLMDYHPEIEIRHFKRHWFLKPLASLLEVIDIWLSQKFTAIIALDPAIATLAQTRAPKVPVIIHPTWPQENTSPNIPNPALYKPQAREVHIAYAGNLGKAHETQAFKRLLKALRPHADITLYIINCPDSGKALFQSIAEAVKAKIHIYPRQIKEGFHKLMHSLPIDFGLVLMKNFYAGLASPSKFSGYLFTGIPLLYIGPPGSNGEVACSQWKAGIAIDPAENDDHLDAIARKLLDLGTRRELRHNVPKAAEHFSAQGPEALAKKLHLYFDEQAAL